MKYDIVPLSMMIEEWAAEDVTEYLCSFICDRDKELELFLRNRAVEFERRDLARTFLLVHDERIIGYFSLASTVLEIKDEWPVSNTLKKKMNAVEGPTTAFLIGQVCKAKGVEEKIGPQIIDKAMGMFRKAREICGGRVVCVDCKRELLGFYEENGFRVISESSESGLFRLVLLCQ